MSAPTLETERLVLRPHRLGDFDRVAELFASPRSGYMGGPLSRGDAWRFFAGYVGQWDLLGFGSWAIDHRASGAYVGAVSLNFPAGFPEKELGWHLWKEFEGNGYAGEAALRAIDFACRTLGWSTLVSYIDPANTGSVRLAERLGAILDPEAPTPGTEPWLVYRHPCPSRSGLDETPESRPKAGPNAAPILETERLVLRPHRVQDFDRFAEFFASPRSKYVNGPLSRPQAWRCFASDVGQWELLGFGAWAIERRADGAYVGQIGLNLPADFPERELGWLLWDEFEGKGYALEAALCARDFAYRTLGWDTVVSYIDPDNAPSIRLAERMGATPDPDAPTPGDDPCTVYRHPSPSDLAE